MNLPFGCFVQIVEPGSAACADMLVLRRRTYIKLIVTLPRDRALIAGRLPL